MPISRDRVEAPERRPWIPPPPPLALDTPIILPNLATLERVRDALYALTAEEHPPGQATAATTREEPCPP